MTGTTRTGQAAAMAALAMLTSAAHAAGGHHGVDDARILARGECEQESWWTREQGGAGLLHAGANCSLGPVELGVAAEYGRRQGASQTAWGVEAKWAREVRQGLRLGVVLQPGWQAHTRPRYQGTAVIGLATWELREDLDLHLNLGRDIVPRGRDEGRGGVALEWKPAQAWSLVAERYRESSTQFARAGLRREAGRNWSIDLSRAQRLAGPVPSNWTLGLTVAFGDD